MSEKQSNLQSISESYRSRAGFNEGRENEPVQRQNHSEHAGGERGEAVTPPESSVPNTVNDSSLAATRESDELQEDSGTEDPTVIGGEDDGVVASGADVIGEENMPADDNENQE